MITVAVSAPNTNMRTLHGELDGLLLEFHDEQRATLKVTADAVGGVWGSRTPTPWVGDASPAEIAVLEARRQLGRNACRVHLCSEEAAAELAGGMRELGLVATRRPRGGHFRTAQEGAPGMGWLNNEAQNLRSAAHK